MAVTRTEAPTPAKSGKTAASRPATARSTGSGDAHGSRAAKSAGGAGSAASHPADSHGDAPRTAAHEPHEAHETHETHEAPKKPKGPSITVTVPLDRLVSAATSSVTRPIRIARRVVPMKHGLPVYLGIGGLAVIGAVEWPVAAAAGVGVAVLRRWGPEALRPAASAKDGEKKEKEKEKEKDAGTAEHAAENGVGHGEPAGSDEAAEAKSEG